MSLPKPNVFAVDFPEAPAPSVRAVDAAEAASVCCCCAVIWSIFVLSVSIWPRILCLDRTHPLILLIKRRYGRALLVGIAHGQNGGGKQHTLTITSHRVVALGARSSHLCSGRPSFL